ncbi:MAG TPA: FadR/GntR family transcriptional regulator [Acetobacteraceae bacterium]|nr:FadR/GntR family transcriptional regulator [Acetobacteraceae bacterium]
MAGPDLRLGSVERESHLPMRVARLISREVAEGRIRPGGKLPTEQALAASLGVSRNVVREAIARLRSEGILRSRQGVGVFVVESGDMQPLRLDNEALRDRAAFEALFELRRILEVNAAGLAAERRDAAALARIAAALSAMDRADGDGKAVVDADLEFHRAVAAATGNSYIARFIGFISEQVRESIVTTRANDDPAPGVRSACEEHRRVLKAIEEQSPAAARRAMQHHLIKAAQRLYPRR